MRYREIAPIPRAPLWENRDLREQDLRETEDRAIVDAYLATGKIPIGVSGLAAEARKCRSFDEFESDYLTQNKHGVYWHWTNEPDFRIDPAKGPRDMSSMSSGQMNPGELMITSDLENWADYGANGKSRPYVAQIDMRAVPRTAYRQVGRGFGNEFIVNDPSQAKVVRVVSPAKARRLDRIWHSILPYSEATLRRFYEIATGNTGKAPLGENRHLTDQPAFRRWFGDSKVVDADGKPLKLYRGLQGLYVQTADRMEPRKGYAMFFTTSPWVAASYAAPDLTFFDHSDSRGAIFPVYVKCDNLREYKPTISWSGSLDFFKFDDAAMRLGPGHGIVARQVHDIGPRASIQTDPDRLYSYAADLYAFGRGTSIKSAVSNSGAFDPENPVMHEAEQPSQDDTVTPGVYHIDQLPEALHREAVAKFEELANGQRHGPPEKLGGASMKNRGIHVSGLYAGLTEHVGDMTHRMAQHWDFYHGSYDNVREKVELGLRRLDDPRTRPGGEIERQVRANYEFMSHPDRDAEAAEYPDTKRYPGSFQDWLDWWAAAGQRYAEAHAALTVWNKAQWHAREAAVAAGNRRWAAALLHLRQLKSLLSDAKTWTAHAGQVTIGQDGQIMEYNG